VTKQYQYFNQALPLSPLFCFSLSFSLSLCLSGAVSQYKLHLTPGPERKKAKRGEGMLVLFYKTKRGEGKWCKERERS